MWLVKILKIIYKSVKDFKIQYWKIRNRILFKIKGAKFGNNLQVYNKMFLQIKSGHLIIGDNFTFTSGDCLNPLCRNIQGGIYITNDGNINIGNTVGMSSPCLWITNSLIIGNRVRIGGNCTIIDSDVHDIDFLARANLRPHDIKNAPIVIEDDVWLGTNVTVLKGVTIGARSIIGAGSVVTKSIPADCIAAGNPCKVVKSIITNEQEGHIC